MHDTFSRRAQHLTTLLMELGHAESVIFTCIHWALEQAACSIFSAVVSLQRQAYTWWLGLF